MFRIGIVGSRNCYHEALIKKDLFLTMRKERLTPGTVKIISGGAKGADSIGEGIADAFGFMKEIFHADWDTHGKSAGYKRNIEIVENSDLILAYPCEDSKGTYHTIKLAQDKGIPVFVSKVNTKISLPNVRHLYRYTREIVEADPSSLYVFGDNLAQQGKKGQAIIRGLPNAYGIPTKRYPRLSEDAFFRDREDEFLKLKHALENLLIWGFKGYNIVLPLEGMGTGLAQMEKHSPQLFKYMNDFLDTKLLGLLK